MARTGSGPLGVRPPRGARREPVGAAQSESRRRAAYRSARDASAARRRRSEQADDHGSMTCSRLRSVASTSTASSARSSGETARVLSRRSRRSIERERVRRVSASLDPRPRSSSARRRERISACGGEEDLERGVRQDHRCRCRGPRPRCRRRRRPRAAARPAGRAPPGTALTALTAAVTSAPRIGPETSMPSTAMPGCAGSVAIVELGLGGVPATATGSSTSTACASIHQVSGAVHGPGVEVAQTEPLGDAPRDAGLARSGRTVDGDHSRTEPPEADGHVVRRFGSGAGHRASRVPTVRLRARPSVRRRAVPSRRGRTSRSSVKCSRRAPATGPGRTCSSTVPTGWPAACSSATSSTLTPASPAATKIRASSPGRSGTTTVTTANSVGRPPCLPGMRARPCVAVLEHARDHGQGRLSRSRLIDVVEKSTSPAGPGSRRAALHLGAARPAARCRTSEQRQPHWRRGSRSRGRGSEAAIRVTSRTPGPARADQVVVAVAGAGPPSGWRPAAAGARPGPLPRRAAPATSPRGRRHRPARRRGPARAPHRGSSGVGVRTQGRSRKRSGRAAAGPDRSRPAIGCPPTNRAATSAPKALNVTLRVRRYRGNVSEYGLEICTGVAFNDRTRLPQEGQQP